MLQICVKHDRLMSPDKNFFTDSIGLLRSATSPKNRRVAALQHKRDPDQFCHFMLAAKFTLLRANQDRALSLVVGQATGHLNLDSSMSVSSGAAVWIRVW